MEEIIVRKATPEDPDTLLQFEQGVIKAERPFDDTIKEGDINYYNLEEMIKAADVEVAVAESREKLIGSGYARIETSKPFYKHPKHAYLGFMYVVPEYRGKDVVKSIIDYLKAWAIGQNIHELMLEVYAGNEPAIKAYEKTGFEKQIIQMRMAVK